MPACSCSIRPPIGDFAPLQAAIGDEEWVLHAASQDLPSCARSASSRRRSSTPSSPRACSGTRASGSAPSSRTRSASPREGALGRRLVDAAAPAVLARVRGARRRAAVDVRDALVAELVEQGKTEYRGRGVRRRPRSRRRSRREKIRGAGSAACTRCAGRERSRSPASCGRRATTTPASSTSPRAGSCPIARSSPPLIADPQTKRDLAGDQGVHRPREPHASSTAGGRRFERGRASRRAAARAGARRRRLPPPRAWADRNPEADGRLKAARPVVEALAEELGHAGREPAHARPPAPCRLDAARSPSTRTSVGEALAELGRTPLAD